MFVWQEGWFVWLLTVRHTVHVVSVDFSKATL